MKAYHFDQNGYLQGSSDAHPNPLEGGFLLPASSTFVVPPEAPVGQIAKWDGSAWSLVADPNAAAQAAADLAAKTVVAYRDKVGMDTKVLFVAKHGDYAVNGELPVQAGVSYALFDSQPADVLLKNANGVATKKVVGGAVVDRAAADVNKDFGNKFAIEKQADLDIKAAMQSVTGMDAMETTHLMMVCAYQDVVMNLDGTHTVAQIDAAKVELAKYRGLFAQVQSIRAARDAAIALLDTE